MSFDEVESISKKIHETIVLEYFEMERKRIIGDERFQKITDEQKDFFEKSLQEAMFSGAFVLLKLLEGKNELSSGEFIDGQIRVDGKNVPYLSEHLSSQQEELERNQN